MALAKPNSLCHHSLLWNFVVLGLLISYHFIVCYIYVCMYMYVHNLNKVGISPMLHPFCADNLIEAKDEVKFLCLRCKDD